MFKKSNPGSPFFLFFNSPLYIVLNFGCKCILGLIFIRHIYIMLRTLRNVGLKKKTYSSKQYLGCFSKTVTIWVPIFNFFLQFYNVFNIFINLQREIIRIIILQSYMFWFSPTKSDNSLAQVIIPSRMNKTCENNFISQKIRMNS